jgi:hypothetical protein
MIATAGLATALPAPLGGRVLVDAASGAAIPVTVAAAPAAGPAATGPAAAGPASAG